MTFVLSILACSEFDFHRDVDLNSSAGSEIDVTPPSLQWGLLGAGQEAAHAFLIHSLGDTELLVTSISVTLGAESFSLLAPETEFILEPEESVVVDVVFSPVFAFENIGRVDIESDDPDEFVVSVDLLGEGSVPELRFEPSPVDFGEVGIGCKKTLPVDIVSVGTDPLAVGDLSFAGDGRFTLIDTSDLPVVIAPGEAIRVEMTVSPSDRTALVGTLFSTSNDQRGVVTANVLASGVYGEEITEGFVIPPPGPVDILFAVDQTPSMLLSQEALIASFSTFIAELSDVVPDWQVGVVTDDDGCFNSGLLTPLTPDFAAKFETAVLGVGGTYSEALLELAAISLSQIDGCNAGFARAGAQVHVIVVTDEYEQSGQDWDVWVDSMATSVADAQRLVVSGIVDLTLTCGDPFHAGFAGYGEAADATGGILLDICDPLWPESIRELAGVSTEGFKTLVLGAVPDPASIEVTIDGEGVTTWVFDAGTNAIEFTGDFVGGEEVTVSYGTWPDCP